MRTAETRSILARSAFDARSLRMPNDSASTIRSSVLSAGGDPDRSLGVDEELVRSGPYLSHYREMVSRQRGADGHLSEDTLTSTASTPRGSVSGPPAALTRSAPATTKRLSSSLSGNSRAWKFSHKGRLLVAQLCQASRDGNVKWAEQLLKDGADIDGHCVLDKTKISPAGGWSIKEKAKATPLVCAVEGSHLEMVKLLLDRGADPNNPDAMEPSALVIAVQGATKSHGAMARYKEIVTLLLDNEANAEAPEELPTSSNPLTIAITQRSRVVADLLLQHGANPNQPRTNLTKSAKDRDWSPLHVAAEVSEDLVGLLLDSGATVGLTGFRDGVAKVTALHVAGDHRTAQRLIDAGASVFAVDSNGQTPLFWAVKQWEHRLELGTGPSEEIIWLINVNLQNGSPVNLRDAKGKTPMALVEKKSTCVRVINALTAAGAESNR